MIHGHSKIELTNVNTGEVQVVEHDNYVTNYLRDILTPANALGDSMLSTISSSTGNFTIDKFKGLIMFKDPLDNDPDNYKFPLTNDMVAHAGNDSYSGTDATRGSFNSVESSTNSNSATFVWDFNQSQGNGTISSLGLTTFYGGIAGSGNPLYTDTVVANNVYLGQFFKDQFRLYADNFTFVDEQRGYFYRLYWNSPTLTIYKWDISNFYTDINPFEMNFNYNKLIASNTTELDNCPHTSYTVSPSATGYQAVAVIGPDAKVYFTQGGTWNDGVSKTFDIIDLESGTISSTTLTLTNRTGVNLNMSTSMNSQYVAISDSGYMCIKTVTNNNYAYINMSDDTDCGLITDDSGNNYQSSNNYICNYFGNIYLGDAAWDSSANRVQAAIVYDDKHVRYIDAQMRYRASSQYRQFNSRPLNRQLCTYVFEYYSGTSTISIMYNPCCLLTKNNLSAPVTKTSEMTMRVTYTLTKS